jgi:hypothetical protein
MAGVSISQAQFDILTQAAADLEKARKLLHRAAWMCSFCPEEFSDRCTEEEPCAGCRLQEEILEFLGPDAERPPP